MTESRTFRAWLVTTLFGASGLVVIVTAWALWPTFYEWWTVRTLIEKLKVVVLEKDVVRCGEIVDTLTEFGSIVPALVELMKDSSGDVRCWAIETLEGMPDDPAKAAIPAVIEALHDEDRNVRHRATYMLGNHPKIAMAAIPAFRQRILDRGEERWVRLAAFNVLRELDGLDSEVLPHFRALAQSDDDRIRNWAENKIKEIDAEASAAARVGP